MTRWPRVVLINAVWLCTVSFIVAAAEATPLTVSYEFTASGFPAGAPTDPVKGTVTVTFDPALFTVLDVPVDAIGLTIAGHTYTPAEVTFDFSAALDGVLTVGGSPVNGNNQIAFGTNDFFFRINQALTLAPSLQFFSYSTAGNASQFFASSNQSVAPAAVPEPSTGFLVATSVAGLLGYRRRRRSSTTAEAAREWRRGGSHTVQLRGPRPWP